VARQVDDGARGGFAQQTKWVQRLSDIFDGIDLSNDGFDARPWQVRALARSTAGLVLALDKAQGARSTIGHSAIKFARRILKDVPLRS
jgi:hypothetical protein